MKFYNIYEKEDVAALALYHLPFYSSLQFTTVKHLSVTSESLYQTPFSFQQLNHLYVTVLELKTAAPLFITGNTRSEKTCLYWVEVSSFAQLHQRGVRALVFQAGCMGCIYF